MKILRQASVLSQCRSLRRLVSLALVTVLMVIGSLAVAGPGAHGPNGEHLDAPAMRASAGPPRFATSSEAFELVGELERGVLTLYLDRYDTNQPVPHAKIELESGPVRAVAQYQADRGTYQVSSPEFLGAISKPGDHSLVMTVLAGRDTDLLDATLQIPEQGGRSASAGGGSVTAHRHLSGRILGAVGVVLLIAAALYSWRRHKRNSLGTLAGVSQ